MTRRRRWLLLPWAALAVGLIVVLLLFDWNWLKRPLTSWASAKLGRQIEIAGPLDVDLSLHPRIKVGGLRIANPAWASDGPMLAVDHAEVVVDLRALLHGKIELPEVDLAKLALRLETRPDGPPNWKFKEQPSNGPPPIPEIGQLRIAGASVRYLDHGSGRDVVANLDQVAGSTDRPDGGTGAGIALTATGKLEDQPLHLQLRGPPLAELEHAAKPFDIAGELKLGASDLAGKVTVDLGKDVPAVSATLHSDQVATTELAGLLGIAAGPSELAQSRAKSQVQGEAKSQAKPETGEAKLEAVLSGGLKSDRLPRLSADLDYTIGQLTGPDLALQDVKLVAGLHERLPSLTLKGGGSFRGEPVTLDVQAGPAKGATLAEPRYQIEADIAAGQSRITASGGVDDPERLQGVHVQFAVNSPDLTEVLRQAGIDLPKLPGLQAKGQLVREGQIWRLGELYAQVGESDLSGRLEVDLSHARPLLSADLHSDRLRAADLMPAPADQQPAEHDAIKEGTAKPEAAKADAAKEAAKPDAAKADAAKEEAAKPEAGKEQAATEEASKAAAKLPAILTASGINFAALPKVDADLKFQGDDVQAPEVRFDQLKLDLQLRDRIAVVDASGKGKFREFEPIVFEAHAGTKESLENPQARYPIDLTLQAGDSKASAKGTVDRPLDYTGLDVDVAVQGQDLQAVGKVLKLPLPATPPYDLRAKVSHQPDHQRWNLVAIRGKVGDSDLGGDVSLELSGERPTVVADLKSKRLDFDDLGVLVGRPPDTQPGETASPAQRQEAAAAQAAPKVLSDTPFNLPDLKIVDARVKFEGETVEARKVPLQNLGLELTLEDGKLRLDPLRLGVADGQLEAVADFVSQQGALDGSLNLSLKQIKLGQLLSRFNVKLAGLELEKKGVGTFVGRAQLKTHGNSIHGLAAGADGKVVIVMDGGQINALIIEGIGLDVGETLGLMLTQKNEGADTTVPIQCFIGRFDVQQGVMQAQALVLDTTDSTITGKGDIDLGKETLALELLAHPKDASVLTASTPVRIEGTFKHPKIGVVTKQLEEKSLAALALGVLLPVVGAILPFIEPGETKGSNCGQLLETARAAMPPAPSQTSK